MNIFLTGGTGFVGTFLSRELLLKGHKITILTRKKDPPASPDGRIRFVTGDPKTAGPWMAQVPQHDWIINLAGASISTKWTDEAKKTLYDSRVLTTKNLVAALAQGDRRQLFCSTSAPGYYGPRGEEELTEDSPPGQDFLAKLARDWEAEALKAQDLGVRTVVTRFGVVLGKDGGMLGQLVPIFQKFLGGPVGDGQQWLAWVHQQDLVRAFLFLPEHPELTGPVNFCSPNPVRNRDFAKALGQALGRPAFMPAPAFMMRLVLGEFADVILTGQKAVPKKLLAAGFQFTYPTIDEALQNLLSGG
ncbi:MAG: TIGR01777 family oxidoreductase [Desulfobaccales bacterium]